MAAGRRDRGRAAAAAPASPRRPPAPHPDEPAAPVEKGNGASASVGEPAPPAPAHRRGFSESRQTAPPPREARHVADIPHCQMPRRRSSSIHLHRAEARPGAHFSRSARWRTWAPRSPRSAPSSARMRAVLGAVRRQMRRARSPRRASRAPPTAPTTAAVLETPSAPASAARSGVGRTLNDDLRQHAQRAVGAAEQLARDRSR